MSNQNPHRPHAGTEVTLIGLHGAAGAGKTTIAAAMRRLERPWRTVAFADPIRLDLLALDPLLGSGPVAGRPVRISGLVTAAGPDHLGRDEWEHQWDKAKRHPVHGTEVRGLMQRYGTEVGRARHGEDVWVRAGMAQIDPDRFTVVADVRFPDEAEAVRAAGGVVLKVVTSVPGRLDARAGTTHASTRELPAHLVDDVVDNRLSPEQMARIVIDTADRIVAHRG